MVETGTREINSYVDVAKEGAGKARHLLFGKNEFRRDR